MEGVYDTTKMAGTECRNEEAWASERLLSVAAGPVFLPRTQCVPHDSRSFVWSAGISFGRDSLVAAVLASGF